MAGTRKELRELNQQQKKIGALQELNSDLSDSHSKLDQVRRRMRAIREEIDARGVATKRLTAAMAAAERKEAKLAGLAEDQSKALGDLQRQLREAGVDVNRLGDHERTLADRIADTNRRLGEQRDQLAHRAAAERRLDRARERGEQMQASGAKMMGAGAVMSAPLVAAVKQAMTLEDAMADIKKVVNFKDATGIQRLHDQLIDMSTRVPKTAAELGSIAAAAGRSNVPEAELTRFTESAAKMAVAFDMEADASGEMMAKWRTAFRMTQPAVEDLGDRINALTNKFGGKSADVTDMVTRIGPLGEVAGVAAPAIAALAGLMNSVGVESEIGATGIKNMMLAMSKGENATKDQNKAFAALGLEAEDVSKKMQIDSNGTIVDVLTRISKLSKDKQAGMLDQLFGSESIAAIAPLLTNLGQLQTNLQLVGDKSAWAGSMNKEFLGRIGTTSAQAELAANNWTALSITIGEKLLPPVNSAILALGRIASGARAWANANPALAGTLTKIAAVIAVVLIAGGALLVTIGTLLGPLAYLGFMARMSGPGLLMLKHVMLAVRTAAMFLASGLLKAGMMMLANPIVLTIVAIVAAALALSYAAQKIYDNWGAISAWFSALWQKIKAVTVAAIQAMIQAFLRFTPQGLLIRAFAKVWPYLAGLGARFFEFGGHIIRGLVGGIIGSAAWLRNKIVGLAKNVTGWFKNALGIHSPSRVFMGLGGHVTDGLALGLDRGAKAPIARVESIAARMAAAGAVSIMAPGMAAGVPATSPAGIGSSAGAAAAGGPVTIHVYGAPGQSEAELARLVAIELDRRDRAAAAARRSSFRDDD
ncbi:MAG TPA: phage tail tape measure protein [Allosphingosinicella sp.]